MRVYLLVLKWPRSKTIVFNIVGIDWGQNMMIAHAIQQKNQRMPL